MVIKFLLAFQIFACPVAAPILESDLKTFTNSSIEFSAITLSESTRTIYVPVDFTNPDAIAFNLNMTFMQDKKNKIIQLEDKSLVTKETIDYYLSNKIKDEDN